MPRPLKERQAEALRDLAEHRGAAPSWPTMKVLAARNYVRALDNPEVTIKGEARVSIMPAQRNWDLVTASSAMLEAARARCERVIRRTTEPCSNPAKSAELLSQARAARIRLIAIDMIISDEY